VFPKKGTVGEMELRWQGLTVVSSVVEEKGEEKKKGPVHENRAKRAMLHSTKLAKGTQTKESFGGFNQKNSDQVKRTAEKNQCTTYGNK